MRRAAVDDSVGRARGGAVAVSVIALVSAVLVPFAVALVVSIWHSELAADVAGVLMACTVPIAVAVTLVLVRDAGRPSP